MKKIILSLLALGMIVLSCGCGGNIEIDMKEFCNDMKNDVKFAAPVEEAYINVAKMHFNVPEETEFYVYYGSSTYPDCFCIFKAAKEEDKEAIYEAIDAKKNSLITTYESYAPEEVDKINACFLEEHGDYVIFAISSDRNGIKEVMKKYFGQANATNPRKI